MLKHKGTVPIKTERLYMRRIRLRDWKDTYEWQQAYCLPHYKRGVVL